VRKNSSPKTCRRPFRPTSDQTTFTLLSELLATRPLARPHLHSTLDTHLFTLPTPSSSSVCSLSTAVSRSGVLSVGLTKHRVHSARFRLVSQPLLILTQGKQPCRTAGPPPPNPLRSAQESTSLPGHLRRLATP
jgi:hypothetical protein